MSDRFGVWRVGVWMAAVLLCAAVSWGQDDASPGEAADKAAPDPFAGPVRESRSAGYVDLEIPITLAHPTRMYLTWQVRVLPDRDHPPMTRIRMYRQLPSGQWRIIGTLAQLNQDVNGRTRVMMLEPGSYRLDVHSRRMAWKLTQMYPDGDPSQPRMSKEQVEAAKDAAPPAEDADPLVGEAEDPLPPEPSDTDAETVADKPQEDEPAKPPAADAPAADADAFPPAVDPRRWKSLVKRSASRNTADREYPAFTLDQAHTLRFTWKTEPLGNSPQFRVTLAAWNESINKFTNIGVIVQSNSRVQGSAEKKLPPDRYRLEISGNRVQYEFNVEQLLPDPKPAPAKD